MDLLFGASEEVSDRGNRNCVPIFLISEVLTRLLVTDTFGLLLSPVMSVPGDTVL